MVYVFLGVDLRGECSFSPQVLCGKSGDLFDVHINFTRSWRNGDHMEFLLAALRNCLGGASKVKSVTMEAELFSDQGVNPVQLLLLCDVVADLKGLQAVRFAGWNTSDPRVPMQYLSRIIRRAHGINKLELSSLQLHGSTADYHEFGSALSTHQKLKVLDCHLCRIARGQGLLGNLNPVLKAIAEIQTLKGHSLDCWIPEVWSGATQPPRELLLPLVKALEHRNVIENGVIIEGPKRLRALNLAMEYHGAGPLVLEVALLYNEEVQLLASTVANRNCKLQRLTAMIMRASDEGDQCLTPLITALGGNTSLKALTFQFHSSTTIHIPFRDATLGAIADMLETKNWSITKLSLSEWQGPGWKARSAARACIIMKRIRIALRLNSLGRSELLKENPNAISRKTWVRRLCQSKQNLNCLYYLLSMNPSLCANCGEGVTFSTRGVATTRTRKRRKLASL